LKAHFKFQIHTMAFINELIGGQVIDKVGNLVDLKADCAGKTIGLYFSANWCPPCRKFTPELSMFYKNYNKSKNFEIIFVSADRTQKSFADYYNSMPWLALEYKYNKKMV
jgi:nucleoredoxin